MARAEELLEGTPECSSHGWLTLDQAPFTRDPAEREKLAAAALEIARRYGDTDLEYDALALLGEACVAGGKVAEGMRCVDQAMTAVSSGEVAETVAVSDICCRLLGACEAAVDVRRAEQWMPVVERLAWKSFVPPVCRTHYGGILIAVGRWQEAEQQLTSAIDTLEHSYRLMREGPRLRLAELRLRQGRLAEARRLLEGSESHPSARRALAALAQAEGDAELAEELAQLCLCDQPADSAACAPVLCLLAEARLALADVPGAVEAMSQLEELAEQTGDDAAVAGAALARGRIAVAGDSGAEARVALQEALRRFTGLGLPLEAARTQLELARTLSEDSPRAAVAEARAALDTFERIGAARDADAAVALIRDLGGNGRRRPTAGRSGLTGRETEVLELLGEGCSNADIAERLVISRRTAEHHVASVLSKLDLRNRAEAAAHATRARQGDR
jgi:DNA-binding NarL/FixJ family response regulator